MASPITKRKKARSLLVQSLYEWQLSDNDLAQIVRATLTTTPADSVDADYYRQALYKIGEQAAELDQLVAPFLDRELSEVDPIELAILRMATFELQFRLDVPYKVVINEALQNAKTFGATESHKFINGVLDKLAITLRKEETATR